MSKSRGNVQDPDALVGRYGADAVRLFLMFMGPWDQGGAWNPTGINGIASFLRRVWTIALDPNGHEAAEEAQGSQKPGDGGATAEQILRVAAHRTLQQVTEEHAGFRWNTMVAHLMELTNLLMRYRGTAVAGGATWDEAVRLLVLMLAPLAPHISEELWSRRLSAEGTEWRSIHTEAWPAFDPALVTVDQVELPVQVNGRLRDRVPVRVGLGQEEIESIVMARPKVKANLQGKQVVRVVHVPGRLVNIVVR